MSGQSLALKQSLALVQSDECVTTRQNETPVIELLGSNSPSTAVIMAVNFLRCGCPSVQIVNTGRIENKSFVDAQVKELAGKIDAYCKALQLGKESFQLSSAVTETARNSENIYYFTVTTLTRTMS